MEVSTAARGGRGGRMSWSAGCRAGWAGGSLADAIRLAGQVAAVERFAMIVGWRRASVYDPATETNQSLRAPGGRAGSVERTRLTGCPRRGSGVGLWRFLPRRVAVEAVG